MTSNLMNRLDKIEGVGGSSFDIPVWVEDPAAVPAAVDAMIARGEIYERDRRRCLWWHDVKIVEAGYHERVVDILDQVEKHGHRIHDDSERSNA